MCVTVKQECPNKSEEISYICDYDLKCTLTGKAKPYQVGSVNNIYPRLYSSLKKKKFKLFSKKPKDNRYIINQTLDQIVCDTKLV